MPPLLAAFSIARPMNQAELPDLNHGNLRAIGKSML
jgi:hypothetical protein